MAEVLRGVLESIKRFTENGWSWAVIIPVLLAIIGFVLKQLIKMQENTMPVELLQKKRNAEELGGCLGIVFAIVISIGLIVFYFFFN